MWILYKKLYDTYANRLMYGNLTDPWVVHYGSIYMFFLGEEEEALSSLRVALSFNSDPLLVRTLAFLEGIYNGIEETYEIYKRYVKKLLQERTPVDDFQWELLFVGDLAFYLGDNMSVWFYYKKYPNPRSKYMLRRKARLLFYDSPEDSRILYSILVRERERLSYGDMLRYAYLLGPRKGRIFLYEQIKSLDIGHITSNIADNDFENILEIIESIESAPVFEGILTHKKWNSRYIALSVEVLAHLLGHLYMPWSNFSLRRYGFLRERMRISYRLWDYGYSYEYHFAYLPPWWHIGVEYLERRWKVRILVLSRMVRGKRRCIWGDRSMCNSIIDIYDRQLKPIVEVK